MTSIYYFCRGKCRAHTPHKILYNTFDLPVKNFSKIKCLHCSEHPFSVEFDKLTFLPNQMSRRVTEVIGSDEMHEQPSDICSF